MFFFVGSIVGFASWVASAVLHYESITMVMVVSLCECAFVVLYVRRSLYAWHAALIIAVGFGVYHLTRGRHPRADIIIGTLFIAYLFVVRQPYFDYIRIDPAVKKT